MGMSRARQLMREWALEADGEAFVSTSGLVQPVISAGGRAVLKVADNSSERLGADALAVYDGSGAVPLLRRSGPDYLMPRLSPGYTLDCLVRDGHDLEALDVLIEVADKLHRAPLPNSSFPDATAFGRALFDERYRGGVDVPEGLVRDAGRLYEHLARTQAEPVLCHGDLHHYNILYDDARG